MVRIMLKTLMRRRRPFLVSLADRVFTELVAYLSNLFISKISCSFYLGHRPLLNNVTRRAHYIASPSRNVNINQIFHSLFRYLVPTTHPMIRLFDSSYNQIWLNYLYFKNCRRSLQIQILLLSFLILCFLPFFILFFRYLRLLLMKQSHH